MKNINEILFNLFFHATQSVFPEAAEHLLDGGSVITHSTQPLFGHYQFNSAMRLAKSMHSTPRAVAEALVQYINTLPTEQTQLIERLEIAGPGFINITLKSAYIAERVSALTHDPHLGIDIPAIPQRIIIDFSSPNIAKEMHVGHLRSTIIGDCLARVFEFLGHNVIRLNHLGDWGTSFGMLIAYIKKYIPEILSHNRSITLSELMAWYKVAKQQFDQDPHFKHAAQQEVVALQRGDPYALTIWERICAISQEAYQEIYDLLDVKLIYRGESFYNPFLANVVADLEQKGLIQVSDGAKCVFVEGFSLPLMVQKCDGGYTYDTTDLAALRHRIQDEKADRIIYVTDAGQSVHFALVFAVGKNAGYMQHHEVRLDHVPFGLVLGPDGKKFRTRSGETERLIDLLTAAINHADHIIQERNLDLSREEKEHLARVLGIGAVKYADLASHRVKDYIFSYERMLKFEGNTAVFLLYAYVRAQAIQRRLGIPPTVFLKSTLTLTHPSEIILALHIAQFGEILELVADELLPHRLTDYLYALAEKFNAFFRDCRVEGSSHQSERLILCNIFSAVMQQGLFLLGISTVDRM